MKSEIRAFWPCIDSNGTTMFKAKKGTKDTFKIVHVTSVVQPKFRKLCEYFLCTKSAVARLQAEECTRMHHGIVINSWLHARWRLTRKRRHCWIKLCLFSLHNKKYSHSLLKLRLNHWCHMDYFNNVLTTFLGLECVSCIAVYCRVRWLSKMSEGLMGLERHEDGVINDRIFIYGWTVLLSWLDALSKSCWSPSLTSTLKPLRLS